MPEQNYANGNGETHPEALPSESAAAFGETLSETEDFIRRQWRENPLQVAAVVAGVGLLLGLLLGRRR